MAKVFRTETLSLSDNIRLVSSEAGAFEITSAGGSILMSKASIESDISSLQTQRNADEGTTDSDVPSLQAVASSLLSIVESAINPTDDYSEPTFTDGILTSLTTWTSNEGTKVSSKTFTYTSGNLTSVVEKDGSDVTTLTKTLTYDGDGNLASITKDYA